jgi:hypothetical protein
MRSTTPADMRALAQRLRARATGVLMDDRPAQQGEPWRRRRLVDRLADPAAASGEQS